MSVIGIDKGHTLQNGGSCGACGLLKESVENRLVGDKVIAKLQARGYIVIDCSCDYATSESEQLAAIVRKANAQHLDLFFSLHLNSFNGNAYGSEIFTTTTTSQENKNHADRIINNYCNKLGFTNRGHKYNNNLYVLRNTNAKAMLLEMCFVDNQGDYDKWKSFSYDTIADVIVEGILDKISDEPVVQKPQETPKEENTVVSMGTSQKVLGDRCKDIQHKLITLGYNLGKWGANGIFGEYTYNAIIQFQKDHSNVLEVDGSCGNATTSLINKLYNEKVQANRPRNLSVGNPNRYVQWVADLQAELNRQGYRDNNGNYLRVDGYAGTRTYQACCKTPLTKDCHGNITRLVQVALTNLGFNVNGIDSHFGNGMAEAVRQYNELLGYGSNDTRFGNGCWKKILGL